MAIAQTLTTSFLKELFLGVHDFRTSGGDTFKIALYSSSATLNADTTAYTSTGEISGTNYTAGGATLTNAGVSSSDGVAYVTFNNPTWASASFTARGALIYNTTPSANGVSGALTNPSVCVLDFGSDKTVTARTFTVTIPSATSSTALIRLSTT